jgi:hypothetical protein
MECSLCESSYEEEEIRKVVGKEGKEVLVCQYCMICANCEEEIEDEIDEYNWILTKQPNFRSGGWIFMTKEQLQSMYVESYGLLCSECRTFRCSTCKEPKVLSSGVQLIGMCTNLCKNCGWACDDEECDCSETEKV